MLLLRILSAIFQRLPLGIALWLGECIGVIAYLTFPSRRKTTYNNLRLAFGHTKTDKEFRRIAWQMGRNMGQNAVEFFRLPLLTPKNIDNYVEWDSLENVVEALKLNRGAFLLAAHFGNWELTAMALAVKGFTMNLVTKYLKNETLNRFWLATRARLNINPLYREGSLREIIKALKANGLMGFVLDQNTRRNEGIFVNFFGRPACTIPSLAVLTQRLNTPVLPCFTVRLPNGRHRVVIEKYILFREPPTSEDPIKYNTQLYTDIIERYVRRYPDHWIWMHKRWKTQPLP
jgi:KDO2-lipid IV(A) lauroyltransferase